MRAIIKTGGKQYTVEQGRVYDFELLSSREPGSQVQFDVLFATDGNNAQIGAPTISNFFVYGEVVGEAAGEKTTGLKYKPSHNQCRKWGHRQKYTRVKITAIGKEKGKGGHHGT